MSLSQIYNKSTTAFPCLVKYNKQSISVQPYDDIVVEHGYKIYLFKDSLVFIIHSSHEKLYVIINSLFFYMFHIDNSQKMVKFRKVIFNQEADPSKIYLTIFVSYTGKTYYEEYDGEVVGEEQYKSPTRFVDPEPLMILADRLKESVWKVERLMSSIN